MSTRMATLDQARPSIDAAYRAAFGGARTNPDVLEGAIAAFYQDAGYSAPKTIIVDSYSALDAELVRLNKAGSRSLDVLSARRLARVYTMFKFPPAIEPLRGVDAEFQRAAESIWNTWMTIRNMIERLEPRKSNAASMTGYALQALAPHAERFKLAHRLGYTSEAMDAEFWVRIERMCSLIDNAAIWYPFTDTSVVLACPPRIRLERTPVDATRNRNTAVQPFRLHAEDGPAVQFGPNERVYAWHGIVVPEKVITNPEQITIKEIEDDSNIERRRVLIDRYGADRYMRDAGGKVVSVDDWGKLWRLERSRSRDEDIVMVEVINSSPEPDGTFKTYYLRVEPRLRPMMPDGQFGQPQEMTPLNAIASTFGLRGEEYIPQKMT